MNKKIVIKNIRSQTELETSERRKRLTLELPVSLHSKIKMCAAQQEKTMLQIISHLLEEKFKD